MVNRFETKRGDVFQTSYLVVTVGHLVDFRLVLFIFQAFFSAEERTQVTMLLRINTLIRALNQQWPKEGQNLIGNNPNSKHTAQPTLRASCSFSALDSLHGSSY